MVCAGIDPTWRDGLLSTLLAEKTISYVHLSDAHYLLNPNKF